MLRIFRNKKAQSTAEYALLFAVIVGAFTAMQIYVRRGMNARMKDGVDQIPALIGAQAGGDAATLMPTTLNRQYEPYYIREGAYDFTSVTNDGNERGIADQAGGQRDLAGATSSRSGNQTVTGAKHE